MTQQTYTKQEVEKATLEYFEGDELATNVFVSKYALQNDQGEYCELTPDDMHKRLAKEFARIEQKYPNPISEEEIYQCFKDFKFIIPGGSVLSGCGNEYTVSSLSNCVVVESPKDSVSGIFDTAKDCANLFKNRCGVGLDISTLRPDGDKVSNSAKTSSGAWSFAEFYSMITKTIGQKSRRGAILISMDIRHPDIEKFITCKLDNSKVNGANISVRLTKKFMEAVEKDGDHELIFPIEETSEKPSKVYKTLKARDLWKLITETATKSAEPGLQYWDNMVANLPAEKYVKHVATNPCGEICLSPYSSCRLIALNLKNLELDSSLEKYATYATRIADDLVDLEIEQLTKIQAKCTEKDEIELWQKLIDDAIAMRRVGIEVVGVADYLIKNEIRYDSEQAITILKKVFRLLLNSCYRESIELGNERGNFPIWNWIKENTCDKLWYKLDEELITANRLYGRRNVALLTCGPTGSLAILARASSGIEPVFKNKYTRRRKVNKAEYTENDIIDSSGDHWKEHEVVHKSVADYMKENPFAPKLPFWFVEAHEIDWKKRVELQGAIQNYIDHSISSTINLPKGTSPETVAQIYFQAWKEGCKGITIYVDGARDGVLIASKTEQKSALPEKAVNVPVVISENSAPKRPKRIPCEIYFSKINNEEYVFFVGMLNNKPYELFGGKSSYIKLPKRIKSGVVVKVGEHIYDLEVEDMQIKNITKIFENLEYEVMCRMISLSLRHGVLPKFIIEQLQKDPESNMFNFNKTAARVLKKYIKNGELVTSDKYCAECKSEGMIYKDGCATCSNCGYSKCS